MTKEMQSYSAEFEVESVKKIADNSGNLSVTTRQLRIMMQTLSNWQNKTSQGKLVGIENTILNLWQLLNESSNSNEVKDS
ncbi:hypothetical protein [Psychrobacter sp. DAB_AL43B]|uniref:hypothetical protein n=1 Tax=Psychrobacter sp. DAB_AL43B TaxID=1028416 RepID=UPI0009A8EA73|nr:hypothetical protein [Psychrobacter sp. DAB_AL43B]SLJ84759.1 IS3/IS911 family transposase OrfA [Psychrobacter sp. DAB_AL43B]